MSSVPRELSLSRVQKLYCSLRTAPANMGATQCSNLSGQEGGPRPGLKLPET